MLRTFQVLALACAAQAAVTVTWEDCGTAANHIKIDDVTFPSDIEPGMNVTITAHATLDEQITDTTMTMTMASIFKHKFDGCAGATVKAPLNIAIVDFPPMDCPLPAGKGTFVRYVSLSKNMPKGNTTSKLESVDQVRTTCACLARASLHASRSNPALYAHALLTFRS